MEASEKISPEVVDDDLVLLVPVPVRVLVRDELSSVPVELDTVKLESNEVVADVIVISELVLVTEMSVDVELTESVSVEVYEEVSGDVLEVMSSEVEDVDLVLLVPVPVRVRVRVDVTSVLIVLESVGLTSIELDSLELVVDVTAGSVMLVVS